MDNNSSQIVLVKDISPINSGSSSQNLTVMDNRLHFSAYDSENGTELWVSDGTSEGTQLVKDIYPGRDSSGYVNSSAPKNFTVLDNRLYFSAYNSENGGELWVSDGTSEGTQLVKDIYPGNNNSAYVNSSSPNDLTVLDERLYFSAFDGVNGGELWVSDGTSEGTQLVKDINPGNIGSLLKNFTVLDNRLYFSAFDGVNGGELWVSDGTSEGTQLVKDINPGSKNSLPENLTVFDNRLYFSAFDAENGKELWVSDGTSEGTQLVKDINPNSGNYIYSNSSLPKNLTVFDDRLYFTAFDADNGKELWVSDGTSEGTQLVKDINPSSDYFGPGFAPDELTVFDDLLYFTASDGVNGGELWVSDGTSEGTQLVKDIYPGKNSYGIANSSAPKNLTVFDDELYFTASDGVNGNELWVSDGTSEGTQLVKDLNPGRDSSFPYGSYLNELIVFDDELYFVADDGVNGAELFKLVVDELPTIITGTSGFDNLIGTNGADQIKGLNGKDLLDGGGGNDTLDGGNGRDSLIGGAGDDSLFGGNGRDLLIGGAGDDILTGWTGKDIFVLSLDRSSDTITDFVLGSDRLSLGGNLEFNDLSFSGSTIQVGNELLATLDGVDTQVLTADNFV